MKVNLYKWRNIFKRRGLSLLPLFLIVLSSTAAKAEEVFAGLSEMKNVESTYISGRFSHSMQTWISNTGRHAMDLSRGFSALYTYQCYSEESVNRARQLLDNYLKGKKDVELMMRTKQMGGEYLIYESFDKQGRVTQMIIWNSESRNICEIVVVDWKNGLERGSDKKYSDN